MLDSALSKQPKNKLRRVHKIRKRGYKRHSTGVLSWIRKNISDTGDLDKFRTGAPQNGVQEKLADGEQALLNFILPKKIGQDSVKAMKPISIFVY